MQIVKWLFLGSVAWAAAGCRDKSAAVAPVAAEVKPAMTLEGTRVQISLNRSALGISKEKAVSRRTGTYDGVELMISGYVVKDTGQFLVIRQDSLKKEKNEWLEWIPYSSILSVSQSPYATQVEEDAAPTESWQMEAVENLMGMVRFSLRDLPQGELTLWFEKDGKKDFLDAVDIMPGFDRWLYIGVDPVGSDALFMSVVSPESKGFSSMSLPVSRLTPFHKKTEPKHDWRKAAVIAEEGSGGGKIWAQVKPKE